MFKELSFGMAVALCAVVWLPAQEPGAGRGGGAGQGGRGAGAAPAQPPAVPQISRSPAVDQAAHDRGRALWASHCIDCHGSQARGSDTGPNIIRARTVNFDRSAAEAGSHRSATRTLRSPSEVASAWRVRPRS
jgi:mono/diheme cytochrome c family protein